jgi:hypothetical protein
MDLGQQQQKDFKNILCSVHDMGISPGNMAFRKYLFNARCRNQNSGNIKSLSINSSESCNLTEL